MTCKQCNGDRVLPIPQQEWPPGVFQPVKPCPCTAKIERSEYLNRVWAGLDQAKAVATTPLRKHLETNIRIIASLGDLRAHIARVARDTQQKLTMRVCSDIDLMTAWLYSAADIHDPEAAETRDSEDVAVYPRLSNLVDPPDLLVLLVGMKMAPNRAAPNVVMETLVSREFQNKPTWVAERAGAPLGPRHPSYSEELLTLLASWPTAKLTEDADSGAEVLPRVVALPTPETRQAGPAAAGGIPKVLNNGMKIFSDGEKKQRTGKRLG